MSDDARLDEAGFVTAAINNMKPSHVRVSEPMT